MLPEDEAGGLQGAAHSWPPKRHVMVLLCALSCFLNYADRVNASVAIIPMAEEFGWSVSWQSWVLSSFFIGYLPMQIAGAELCRRFSGKTVLGWAVVWWSSFTMLTPVAADIGFGVLLACRILMGLGEALAFPSVYHFLADWVPARERSRSTGVLVSGSHLGTTLALLLSPKLIAVSSWRLIFWFFGGLGYVFFILWRLLAEEATSQVSYEDVADSSASNDQVSPKSRGEQDPSSWELYRAILSNGPCWALTLIGVGNSWALYTIMAWLPSYMSEVFGVAPKDLGFTFFPYFVMAVTANLGGWLADQMLARGYSLLRVRKIVSALANGGAALFVVFFGMANDPYLAASLLSFALAFQVLNTGGYESNYLDIAQPAFTGALKASTNSFASVSGILSAPFSAFILEATGSWRLALQFQAIPYLLGVMIFLRYASADRVLSLDFIHSR